MKNNIELANKIIDKILNKVNDYRFYGYDIPYSIKVNIKQGVVQTSIYKSKLKAKLNEEGNIKLIVKEDPIGTQTKNRILLDINAIILANINSEETLSFSINAIEYKDFIKVTKEYLNDFSHTSKNIDNETTCNIINSISEKLNKCYMKSYNILGQKIIRYNYYNSLDEIFKFHNSKTHFNVYILEKIKNLNMNDFKKLLSTIDKATPLDQDIKMENLLIENYLILNGLGKFEVVEENKEWVVSEINNVIISSI